MSIKINRKHKKGTDTVSGKNPKSKNCFVWLFDKFLGIYNKHTEIVMYLIMGVATTLVNFVVYSLAFTYLSFGSAIASFLNNFGTSFTTKDMDITLANAIAWVIAVLFAYFTNKILVFHSNVWKLKFIFRELGLFVSARLITGIFEIVGPPILFNMGLDVEIFGIEGLVSKAIISVAVIILNYVFSKLFIFKKEYKNKTSQVSD